MDLSLEATGSRPASISGAFDFLLQYGVSDRVMASVDMRFSTSFSLSEVDVTWLNGNGAISASYLETNLLEPSGEASATAPASSSRVLDFSLPSCVSSRMIASEHLGLGIDFAVSGLYGAVLAASLQLAVTYLMDLSFEVAGSRSASISRRFDFSFPSSASSRFIASVDMRFSTGFSLSGVNVTWLNGNEAISASYLATNLLELSVEVTFSALNNESRLDEPGSSLPDGDSASATSNALALGVGLGMGLILLLSLVSGGIFWFGGQRGTQSTDVTESSEFAMDQTDPADRPRGYGDGLHLASGENALASEVVDMGIPFTDPEMLEEGLWVGEYVK
jgi:hypothetical protein